jgi:hypothetical protein
MPNALQGLLADPRGDMRATPRNALMGLLADALTAANDYAKKTDPRMPGGKANPVLGLLADGVSLNSLATTAQRASYGEPLTNKGKANVPYLKPETADALMMAPLSPRNALAMMGAGMADTGVARAALGAHHFSVLDRASKGVADDVADAAFGAGGYVYNTPLRPFENAQATALGMPATPIAERVFSTRAPVPASVLASLEATPVSSDAMRGFADELANEGAMAFMHRDGRRFSVVMPSAKQSGKVQLTSYDTKGAIGDSQHETSGEAIQRLIDAGYSKVLDGKRVESLMQRVMLR